MSYDYLPSDAFPDEWDIEYDDWDDDYEDVVKTEKLDIKDLFSSYRTGTVSYAIEYKENGKTFFETVKHAGCYGAMPSYTRKLGNANIEPVAFYNGIRAPSDHEDTMTNYLEFLFNPKISPWRSIIPEKGLEYELPAKKGAPYFKVPVTKGTSPQTLVSLFIASRAGPDVLNQVVMFNRLIKAGWSEVEALYASIYFHSDIAGTSQSVIDGRRQDWFAFSAHTMNSFEAMKEGTPNIDTKKMIHHNYTPLQSIWYKKGNSSASAPIYNAFTNTNSKYTGLFPDRWVTSHGSLSLERSKSMPLFETMIKNKENLFKVVA